MRIALVLPHIFMQDQILSDVIFAPGFLVRALAEGLQAFGHDITLFTPGVISTSVKNVTADLSLFEKELECRGYGYTELLKKHPLLFITLARQVQGEMVAKAYRMANEGNFDIVHVYANEEEIALPFAQFCKVPLVFTHHDPFNFLAKYKSIFPKYKHLNWIAISESQKAGMPADTNFVGTIYHGIDPNRFHLHISPSRNYVAYYGRIVEQKGVHLAIQAVKKYNSLKVPALQPLILKIAGKHYAGYKKDTYWQETIEPLIDGSEIQYVGFLKTDAERQDFLGNAKALLIPSTFQEPFGMVMIESLACGTPIIGLESGAIPEVVKQGETGFVIKRKELRITNYESQNSKSELLNPKQIRNSKMKIQNETLDEDAIASDFAMVLGEVDFLDRNACRADFEERFTVEKMCREYENIYQKLSNS